MASQQKQKSETVNCPSCGRSILLPLLNAHLDQCLISVDGDADPVPAPNGLHARNGAISENAAEKGKKRQRAAEASSDVEMTQQGSAKRPAVPSRGAPGLPSTAPVVSSSKQRMLDAQPLAERMRPNKLVDFIGQEEVVVALRALIKQRRLPSSE